MNLDHQVVAGVDIGGGHITVSLIEVLSGHILPDSFVRREVEGHFSLHDILETWCDAIAQSFSSYPSISHKKIGIAMPGPFDYKNGISYIREQDKYDVLYGHNVKQLIGNRLGIPPEAIQMDNDAACFLLGEVYKGKLQDYSSIVGITLGTGLGTAYTAMNKSFDAGLWNQQFRGGIIEDFISSRWFVNEFKRKTGIEIKNVRELVERYPDSSATRALFLDFSKTLALFLTEFISKRNAETVIIGGNITKAHPHFFTHTQNEVNRLMKRIVPLRLSVLGENAALIGAAMQFHETTNPSKSSHQIL